MKKKKSWFCPSLGAGVFTDCPNDAVKKNPCKHTVFIERRDLFKWLYRRGFRSRRLSLFPSFFTCLRSVFYKLCRQTHSQSCRDSSVILLPYIPTLSWQNMRGILEVYLSYLFHDCQIAPHVLHQETIRYFYDLKQ